MFKLIRLYDIDNNPVWINPTHIVEIRSYYVEAGGMRSPCGTAIWLVNGKNVLVSDKPDIASKTIMELAAC